jgi:hypothetical protein
MQILGVRGNELHRLGPEGGDGGRRIVEVDGEAVGLVVVCHVAEDVVVDVAEEMHLGLHAPVELCVGECRVLVEETAVPAAHLMVGFHGAVLDVVLLEDLGRFFEELVVDPGGYVPVLFGYQFCSSSAVKSSKSQHLSISHLPPPSQSLPKYEHKHTITTLSLRFRLCPLLKLLIKRHIIKKRPRIIELRVPRPFQIAHRLHHAINLIIPHQTQQRGIYPRCALRAESVPFCRAP